ncbi:MAG: hypothetical protein INQ03_18630 [Candidatus Heimdallarchaeota archaeon]|nr:hypothetical protein [Candidatus Heimdallarchaeota archaeon]
MFDKNPFEKNPNHEYAHWIAIFGAGLLILIGFLAIFGINYTFLDLFTMYIVMMLMGVLILLIEIENDYLPLQYKTIFKSAKIKAMFYFVLGLLLIGSGIPGILLIIAAILLYI